MTIKGTGVTRIVLVFKNVVIKVPNFSYSWQHFLKGILANIQENQTWKWHERKDLLCPVVWCSCGGWVLIMKRADTKRHYFEIYNAAPIGNIDPEEEVKTRYAEWISSGLGGDDKCDNYGYYKNKLVKIDYAQ